MNNEVWSKEYGVRKSSLLARLIIIYRGLMCLHQATIFMQKHPARKDCRML